MGDIIVSIFNYYMILYSGAIILSYMALLAMAYLRLRHHRVYHDEAFTIDLMNKSPYIPAVSIVAPAYNEEKTVITNVNSLLSLDYPDYEVVIVNDGSKDSTLQLLIDNFSLIKVPYAYQEKIKTKPFKALYKSTDPAFSKLTVVDKVNGGTKADASNAGVNVVENPYFVCTDVDCILDKRALYRIVWPTMSSPVRMIAVSATMRMSNGCEVEEGQVVRPRPPHTLIPLFQDIEYARSYLVGKSGFQMLNAINNVSGGFGLFDTEVAVNAGGYDGDSFAEDMDLVARMVRYMCDSGKPYRIVQVPETCCWTEGPSTLKILKRQRNRWGRGILQIFGAHRDMLFKRHYRHYGLITMPYVMLFEMLAPIIELFGYLVFIYLVLTDGINLRTFWLLLLALYLFAQMLSTAVIYYDIYVKSRYRKLREYIWYIFAALLEPIIYHPIIVVFTLSGYLDSLLGVTLKWGTMTRTGVKKKAASAQAGNNVEGSVAVSDNPDKK